MKKGRMGVVGRKGKRLGPMENTKKGGAEWILR
jgi:hypothetical protein